jgi:transcriptional regulator with XRE-family HTH domain
VINIKYIREEELRLTQQELAIESGLHQTNISQIELGKRRMSAPVAVAIERLSNGKYPWTDWFTDGKWAYAICSNSKKLAISDNSIVSRTSDKQRQIR